MYNYKKNLEVWNTNLYILNVSLLITHEIDSAFWKEWEMFGILGDIQGFLVINFILICAALIGLKKLLEGKKNGNYYALLFAIFGIFAFVIHTIYLLKGNQEFKTMVSIGLLIFTLAVSLIQSFLLYKLYKNRKTSDTA